jgi:glycosyltransferase involved in cell wall biosynthesis
VANVLVSRDHISQDHIETVPNGISLARFEGIKGVNLDKEFHISPKVISIAMVGRLHPAKGHRDILPIIGRLQGDNIPCHLIIIGDGELKEDIQKSINDHRLEKIVTLVGQRKDVPQILSAVDILLMPSRWEGLPIALLEGMSLGKAVLATAVGGIPEVIQDGINGLLAESGNEENLELKLRKLISDETLRKRLGSKARVTVYTQFSAESVAKRYESIYRKDLGLYQHPLYNDSLT